mmetsp:Transcript_41741/g.134971  ORF Transcript_41741/g.134971 Transcript_41741/m.134971 type:complete len:334 (+) Transcript_41741:138-1139(+)
MLDALLDCGRHLPVLCSVLAWAPAATWARLRSVRQGFREVLDSGLLLELVNAAAAAAPSPRSLCELFDAAASSAGREDLGGRGWRGGAVCAQIDEALSERAFSALLRGADPNEAQELTGLTPLMRAAEGGSLRLCRLLLSLRATADLSSIGDATALSLALGTSCESCLSGAEEDAPSSCSCLRPAVAALLLEHTSIGLPEAFAIAVRRALQDVAFLPVVSAFVETGRLPVDAHISGPDCRQGSALSAALERRVTPVEGPLRFREQVVARLLELGADPRRPGPYVAWWGGKPAPDIVTFAALNGCDAASLGELLGPPPSGACLRAPASPERLAE